MESPSNSKREGGKDSKQNSPYKKFKHANKEWIPFTSMAKLTPNMPYKILGLVETNHPEYGKGQQATIVTSKGQKCRTQLPGKYLREISPEDVKQIKSDVMNGKDIFLVFREKMVDGSFRIDLTEASAAWIENFSAHKEVPELEDSDNSFEVEDVQLQKCKESDGSEDVKSGESEDANEKPKKSDGIEDVKSRESEDSTEKPNGFALKQEKGLNNS